MHKHWIAVAAAVMLCLLTTITVAADSSLLQSDHTRLTSKNGTYAYTPEGALAVTAPSSDGAIVAIDLDQTINVYETPFLQLSFTSTVPFNIALKLGSDTGEIYPQTAAPAWYEGFQQQPPAAGEGVNAGQYTLSLSIPAYAEYNELAIPKDGKVTLKSVFVMLKGAGGITVEHLAIGEHGEFQTAFGKTGQTAYCPVAVTTAAKGAVKTTAPTYDAGGVGRYRLDGVPVGVVVLLVVSALLLIGMSVYSLRKKR